MRGGSLNFSDYSKVAYDIGRVAKSLGYRFFTSQQIEVDRIEVEEELLRKVTLLQEETYNLLPKVLLDSEIAKREFLIAPIFKLLLLNFGGQLFVEYQIEANDTSDLKGKLDYLLKANSNLLVVEAKKDDFDAGGKQLIAELVALSIAEDVDVVDGAVTNGRVWQFYQLDRQSKTISQEIAIYRFPEDARELVSRLVWTLTYSAC